MQRCRAILADCPPAKRVCIQKEVYDINMAFSKGVQSGDGGGRGVGGDTTEEIMIRSERTSEDKRCTCIWRGGGEGGGGYRRK